MARSLTAQEAVTVGSKAKPEGQRPTYYSPTQGEDLEISSDFEVWAILAPSEVKRQISSYLQTILDNNPDEREVYNEILISFLQEDLSNTVAEATGYRDLTAFYDNVRSSYLTTTTGFLDNPEVSFLQNLLNSSLGSIIDRKDDLDFTYSAGSVLLSRAEAESSGSRREIESWIQILGAYE